MWHTLTDCTQTEPGKISACSRIPEGSLWFSGHFPGEPILPGIAQVKIVFDVLNQVSNYNLILENISRIRFKKIVRPNDILNVIAIKHSEKPNLYTFKILLEEEIVCSGNMWVRTKDNK